MATASEIALDKAAAIVARLEEEASKLPEMPDPTDLTLPYPVEVLFDRVLIRRDPRDTMSPGGNLHLPDIAKDTPLIGTIVAAGPGHYLESGTFICNDLHVGDRVLIARYAGNEFKFDANDAYEYTVLRAAEVLLKVHDSEDVYGNQADQEDAFLHAAGGNDAQDANA